MRSGKILRHSVSIDEQEVFCLIHKPVELLRAPAESFHRPCRLVGRACGASLRRLDQPRHDLRRGRALIASRGSTTKVRTGKRARGSAPTTSSATASPAWRETRRGSPSTHILGCTAVLRALQRRAAFVDHTYRTCEILAALRDPETGDFEQPNAFHKFAVQTIANILELDARHPEEWPGNVINGEHRVSVLSTLFQLHPEVVKWYGRLLEESGVIEDFDGEILKLSPQALAA